MSRLCCIEEIKLIRLTAETLLWSPSGSSTIAQVVARARLRLMTLLMRHNQHTSLPAIQAQLGISRFAEVPGRRN